MLDIIRGTTPNITCTVPYDVPLLEADEVWLSIKQDGCLVVDRKLTDNGVRLQGQTIIADLTQDETLAFKTYPKPKIGVRIRFGNEAVASSAPQEVRILDVVKSGVI